jgi:acetate kinase
MQLLVLNSGSSSLRFDLLQVDAAGGNGPAVEKQAHGIIERIGAGSTLEARGPTGAEQHGPVSVKDHREAVAQALSWLGGLAAGPPADAAFRVDAVGHRIVHGGERFVSPVRLTDTVVSELEALNDLAPLHNPAALQGIRAAQELLGPAVPMAAVFDTAFHATMPPYATTYALPRELAERHHARRYGFHGIAHESMLRGYAALTGIAADQAALITLQLGNGCSAAAIRNGRSVDTSMGFSPLEGLVMGTRSGDLDPTLVGYLARQEKVDAAEVEQWLNTRSGLLGVSGLSSDMRDLLREAPRQPAAALAIELFCNRARKYIGAYLAALGGADAIVFGGGIGEHAPAIRARISEGMEWCGLRLDPERNKAAGAAPARISADDAPLRAYVIPVDESILIAEQTYRCIEKTGGRNA